MELDFVVIGVGVLNYLIGNYTNKENAKILLAGYNTMSKAEREKFDIDEYLKFFKPFFRKKPFSPFFSSNKPNAFGNSLAKKKI